MTARSATVGVLLAGAIFAAPQAAEAKFLLTTGDEIHDFGEVAAKSPNGEPTLKVGYIYEYYGLFWINFWTSGGQYCVYRTEEEGYMPVPKEMAEGMLGRELSKPFWYRFPAGWLILAIGGVLFIAGALIGKAKGEHEESAGQ